ncbi:WbuC family cupin fold metalloprotein [Piscirickettsia litoralis]|uniref:Cupin n=1 Tax=Piscirickettsia litoralis TaxID=1891921 RepID=A0ABX2ZYT1_9GAMM|nr:WbuC family cupin fold metalloprotein [Piscirickettsia litoralis]ODN41732.1 cupin [Piscirickettsia litoralis]
MNTTIDQDLLQSLSAKAASLPRKRINLNFHTDDHAPCHRLLIAIEPNSYVRPHCHADHNKDETMLVLQGRLGLIYFDQDGTVTKTFVLSPNETIGTTIPHGQLHSVIALEAGTVFFESKAGPYQPPQKNEISTFAPAENTPKATDYLQKLYQLFEVE